MIHIVDNMKFPTSSGIDGILKKVNRKEAFIDNYRNQPLAVEAPFKIFGGGGNKM